MQPSLKKIPAVRRPESLSPVITHSSLRRGNQFPDLLGASSPAFLNNQRPLLAGEAGGHRPGCKGSVVNLKVWAQRRYREQVSEKADGTLHIHCEPLDGPGRYERRRNVQSSDQFSLPRNLGVIEGERLRHCRGYHDETSTAKALLSLVAVSLSLLVVAAFTGAL